MAIKPRIKKEPDEIATALDEVSLKRQALADFRSSNEKVFEKIDELASEIATAEAELKRLVLSKWAKPPSNLDKKTLVASEGERLLVTVTYPTAADYYRPDRLPPEILARKGVISAVDSKVIGRLPAALLKKCEPALVKGEAQSPRVSIKEREK